MGHKRAIRTLGLVVAATITAGSVAAGCAPGPSGQPDYLNDGEHGGIGADESSAPADAGTWPSPGSNAIEFDANCGTDELARLGLTLPAALSLSCAAVDPASPSGTARQLQVMRASTDSTPANAAPIILIPSSQQTAGDALAGFAATQPTDLLAAHPVITWNLRGTGTRPGLACASADRLDPILSGGNPGEDLTAAVDTVTAAGQVLSDECISLNDDDERSFYGPADNAADLESVRAALDVDALALWSTGDGSQIALQYGSDNPERVARLVLDAPISPAGTISDRAVAAAAGFDGAWAKLAAECVALSCALGANAAGQLTTALDRATAGDLGPISQGELISTVAAQLGLRPDDHNVVVADLSEAIAAALAGNTAPFARLTAWARTQSASGPQYVARCLLPGARPSPDQVPALAATLGASPAAFSYAVATVACASWPTAAPAPTLSKLEIPVLTLTAVSDPLVGNAVDPAFGAELSRLTDARFSVTWAGTGHGVGLHSRCGQRAIAAFLTDQQLADTIACPA